MGSTPGTFTCSPRCPGTTTDSGASTIPLHCLPSWTPREVHSERFGRLRFNEGKARASRSSNRFIRRQEGKCNGEGFLFKAALSIQDGDYRQEVHFAVLLSGRQCLPPAAQWYVASTAEALGPKLSNRWIGTFKVLGPLHPTPPTGQPQQAQYRDGGVLSQPGPECRYDGTVDSPRRGRTRHVIVADLLELAPSSHRPIVTVRAWPS